MNSSNGPSSLHPRDHRGRFGRGFTLVELVVAITVGAIISGTAAMMLMEASSTRGEIAARSELSDMGAVALETMVRYMREIRQDENYPSAGTPDLQGHAQVDVADQSEIRFDSYGFRLSGTTLQMTIDAGATWHPQAGNVSGLTFSYYGWTPGTEAPRALTSLPLSGVDRNDIRRIVVQLDLARGTETARLRTGIYLRSFMNEVANAP